MFFKTNYLKLFISSIFIYLYSHATSTSTEVIQGKKNVINWENFEMDIKPIKKINWEFYDENKKVIFEKDNENVYKREIDNKYNNLRNLDINNYYQNLSTTAINPLIPLNSYFSEGQFQTVIEWKSSFNGGVSGGTGQQNNSIRADYGLSDDLLFSFYFAEADDDYYNKINNQKSNYHWQTFAFSAKKKLLSIEKSKIDLSVSSSIEYWRSSSGSDDYKSIYNEQDNNPGKQKFDNVIGSLSLPFEKNINKKIRISLVPGLVLLPNKFGSKSNSNNAYGKNFYLGTGIFFELSPDINLLGSYTYPLGPGKNSFDKDLNLSKEPIYSYGINWNVNKKISFQGNITNGFGSTPATGILTIPSDNLNLYTFNLKYTPNQLRDTPLKDFEPKDYLMSFGGLTVNNALISKRGKSNFFLNKDSNGNLNSSYRYSLSNIFQLEIINLGIFKNVDLNKGENKKLRNTYLNEDNLNLRIGGKFLIFSPQKNDFLWTSFKTSFGRNEETNQGYIQSELINTLRLNDRLSINASKRYFYSGIESFGSIGLSSYINFSNSVQLIPEINFTLQDDSEFNRSISLRYLYNPQIALDLFYSNAIGQQDLSQVLKRNNDSFGIRLNYIF
tara:strand:+ start:5818 stop:7659 length:1842 start_codon:yes stop_codon:yes gene_type:complete